MMHNTHELRHQGAHHGKGGKGEQPVGPFIPPRIITNDTLYEIRPPDRTNGYGARASTAGANYRSSAADSAPASGSSTAEGRSRGGDGGVGSDVGLGEYEPEFIVDGFLCSPLLDVGSDLPQGETFRQMLDHVQATEYRTHSTVQEPVSGGAKEDYRMTEIPITREMFMVKLASTLNEWRSGSTPEQYEEMITPLVTTAAERRLNASVGATAASGATARDNSFYRSEYVKPVNSRNPPQTGRRTVMPRLSICVLTEL
jgi:hypothetical protein